MNSLWTIRTSFSWTSLQRNCQPKREKLRTIIIRKKSPTLLWFEKFHWGKNTSSWSSHTAVSISQQPEAYKQPTTSKILFTYSYISELNVATNTIKFKIAKVSKHFQDRTKLSWSRQKDFAPIAYSAQRFDQGNGSTCKNRNRKHNSLLHLEANNTSRIATTSSAVITSSTSPQEAGTHASKTISKSKEKFTSAAQSQNEEEEVFPTTAILPAVINGKTTDWEPFQTQDPNATSSRKTQYDALDWKWRKRWPSV